MRESKHCHDCDWSMRCVFAIPSSLKQATTDMRDITLLYSNYAGPSAGFLSVVKSPWHTAAFNRSNPHLVKMEKYRDAFSVVHTSNSLCMIVSIVVQKHTGERKLTSAKTLPTSKTSSFGQRLLFSV